MSKPTTAVKDRWNKKNYDDILLRVPKGQKAIIRAAAETDGKSLNAYIRKAIEDKMQKHGATD